MPGLGWSQEQLKSLDRTLGQRQGGGLRPVTPSLPETDDERAARIKRDSLLAIMSMPEPLRSQQLAGAQYEPGGWDYLNQGAGSFMRALGTGIGALPKAGAVAVDAVNRLVPIYVPGVSSASNSVFDSPAYHYGEDVAKRIGDVGPLPVTELQDSFVATTLPSAAASVATTALPALIPGVGPAIGAASGAAQQSVSELERAVKDGQTESEALGAFIPNALIGVSDILPGMVARKALTGAATRELGGSLLGSTLRAAGKAGVTEGAQEFGQNIASDVVSGYRPIDIPGALEAGAAGLITGGVLGGGANIAGRAIGRLTPLKPSQQDGMVTSPTISEKIELTPDQMANLAQKNATDAGLTRSPESVAQDFGLQTPDQQQNFANKNAYDAGLSRNPTDVAQTLALPANAHLVNEQGAPIEQAPTPPLVQIPQPQPITARPARELPAIDAPANVLRQDVPDISKVAAARIQNLAETKPLADGRVTRLAPLNTPVAELQRYYESYGVPFHARREGLGWRLTIDPLAQTREQALDPRDVMDQINYAAEQGIRQRGVPNDQQPVRGPDAIAPEVQPAVTEPIQSPAQPQTPQAQAQDPQVLKDELSTLAAKTRRGLLLARDRRTIPQRMAQLQNTLINDYAIDPTEIDAIVGGEPITPRVPISEITNEGQTVPTEVQQSEQGQIQQANAAEASPIEGGQVGQDVRLQLAQPTTDSTLGPGGQTEGIPAPQPKGNLFQRSRNKLARAAAQQELAAQQQIASQQTEQPTEQPTETVQQAQDRLNVPQEDRQRIASVTESLPENQREAAALALTEGRPSDVSTITATPEDVSQAANISTAESPESTTETSTVSLPEPDTEIAPDTPIETKLVSRDEANEAFNRIAKKLMGKVFANPVGPIFDPEIWADVSKIAVHYSEYYARAGLAGAQSGYRAFAKYMRESLNGVTINVGGHNVNLGDFFVGANGGSDAKRLYAETKSKLVRERKALAGSLQRQRVAASDALKAQGITSSISRNLSKLKETKLHSGFKDMLKQAGISFAFTKGDRLGDRLSMYSAAVERAIGDRIDPVLIRQLNQNDGKLSNLSVADLAQINNVLKSFKKLNSDFATDVAGSYINVRDDYATKVIDEIKAYKPNEAADTAIEHIREKLGYYGGTLFDIPYTLIRSFVGGKNGTTMQKLLYDNLIDGERKALRHVVDYIKAFDSLTRQYKMHDPVAISEFSSTVRDYTLDGKKVKLTEGDLLYLYMIAQSPDARQRVIGSKVVRRANREFTTRSIEVTEQFLSDVEKTATPFMKDFAEIAFSNKADLYPAMNAAVKETTGHDVGYTGDRHVDLHTTDAQKDKGLPEIVNFASQTSLERSGIIQSREGGNNVYVLDNGIGMHMAWLKRATDIAYKLVPGRMAMAVLEKPDMRESIVSRWGRENYNVLLEQTRQMTGLLEPERSAALSRTASAARWMAHLYGGGRLAFRPTSVMQQYSGALLAMAEMSTNEKLHMPEAHLINPILTESDRAKVAHNSYLDFRIHQNNGRGFYEPSDIGEFEAASRATTAYLREIRDIGFLPITLGDNAVIKMAWTAVEGANPRKANESDTAYYTRIGERVEHIIRTTQNPVLSSDMTHIHRSSRRTAWGPFTFMLTSSSAAMRNVFVRAVQEGDITKATVAAVSLLSATAITTLHGLAVYGVYGRDEEEKRNNLLKTIATRIGGDIVNTAAPGVGGEIAGLISSVIKGITPDDRSPLGALSGSAIRTISAFKAENPNPHAKGAAFARFASNLMPLFGLPSYPLELASGVLGQMSRKQRSGSLLPQLKGGLKGGQLKNTLGG